ncbi:hypothetical protein D3C79_909060 [compost metagenome]
MLLKPIFTSSKAFHFKLIKLMHAKDTFHIFTIRPSFTTEATGVANITKWQLRLIKNLIGVHATKYMLGTSL